MEAEEALRKQLIFQDETESLEGALNALIETRVRLDAYYKNYRVLLEKADSVIKEILKSFSKVCTLLLSVVLYSSFLIAYFSENQSVYFSVNDYGEGFIELLVFSIAMVLVFVGFFVKNREAKQMIKNKENRIEIC